MSYTIYWFTGQPGAGKTTLAKAWMAEAVQPILIDADEIRELFPESYDEAGRRRNIMRIQTIAKWEAQYRDVCVACIAPYRREREIFKAENRVVEIYCHTRTLRGREAYFVAGYEPPLSDFIDIDTTDMTVEESVQAIYQQLGTFA